MRFTRGGRRGEDFVGAVERFEVAGCEFADRDDTIMIGGARLQALQRHADRNRARTGGDGGVGDRQARAVRRAGVVGAGVVFKVVGRFGSFRVDRGPQRRGGRFDVRDLLFADPGPEGGEFLVGGGFREVVGVGRH